MNAHTPAAAAQELVRRLAQKGNMQARFDGVLVNVYSEYATNGSYKNEPEEVLRKRLDAAIAESDRLKLYIQHKKYLRQVELEEKLAQAGTERARLERRVHYLEADCKAWRDDSLKQRTAALRRSRAGDTAKRRDKGKPSRVRKGKRLSAR